MLATIKECVTDLVAMGVVFLITKLDDSVIQKIDDHFEEDLIPLEGQVYEARHIDLGELDGVWVI